MLAAYAGRALWVWTGNPEIAQQAGPVLALYAIGNGLLSLGAFPYFLQYAKGNLKLHIIGSVLYFLIYIPTLIFATIKLGAIGAGLSWVLVNLLYLLFWLPKVHSRFFDNLNAEWFKSVAAILTPALLAVVISHRYLPWQAPTRMFQGIILCGIGLFSIGAALLGSSRARKVFLGRLRMTHGIR